MRRSIANLATAVALAASATVAMAQYTGPSAVPAATVKQLLDQGKDDQKAVLRGRIVSHDGGKNYTFADDTGRIRAEIEQKYFPPGQPIDADQLVELSGELDKDSRKVEFEVKQPIRLVR